MIAAIIPFLTALMGGVAAQFVKVFSIESLKFLAWRAFILFLVFVAMPIVLYNIASDLILDLMTYAVSYVSGANLDPVVIQLTGMGGWIGQQIGIDNMLAMVLSAVATRFTMGFIPFLRG